MPKRRSRPQLPHEPHPLKRVLIVLGLLLLAVLFLGGFWFLGEMGPKEVDFDQVQVVPEVTADVRALQEESLELESRFEEVLAMRAPEPQDLRLLEAALEKQEAYLARINGVDSEAMSRARFLRQRYQEFGAETLRDASLALENEAAKLAEDREYDEAREKYEAAYDLQRQINERFPLSSAYNVGRATRLERQARFLTAEPLLQSSFELEREAEALIEAQNWSAADEKLGQAIELQDRLNREFRGTNQASVARLERLRIQRIGIQSGQDYTEIEAAAALADERRAEGENLAAADLYLQASRLQRRLNENFRESPYASSERVAEFQRKAETAQSYELGLSIENNHRRLRELLADRRTFEAAEVIVNLRRDIEQMQEAFPRSSLNDGELQLKVRYLNLVQNELGFIQDRIYEALLPIPEEVGWRILRTEVSQALYALIMGTNPSRNRGDTNPVDSVSWIEAKSFCERLSWIMGKPVRLPTENEFRQALGRLRYVVLEDHVWSASNSDGVAQSIGQKEPFASGCYDLLGNVSEWLESVDRFETEDARHIGGHAQDRLETIFTVPIREAKRAERSRVIGFRVVVDADQMPTR